MLSALTVADRLIANAIVMRKAVAIKIEVILNLDSGMGPLVLLPGRSLKRVLIRVPALGTAGVALFLQKHQGVGRGSSNVHAAVVNDLLCEH